jgi:hypothetical protein
LCVLRASFLERVAFEDAGVSGFPAAVWRKPVWCLYDDMSGNTRLVHPYRLDLSVPCPHCGAPLRIADYRARCCGQEFKTGFGSVAQVAPVGRHARRSGRGWGSLRPYERPAS